MARVYFGMGRDGVFPPFMGAVHPEYRTPGPALIIQGVWGCLLLLTGTFDMLTDTLIFVIWIFYGAGAFGIFVLRKREPDAVRPFRAPGYPWVPATFVLFSTLFLVLTVYNDIAAYRAAAAAGKPALINSAFGMALVLAGTPIYFYYRKRTVK